MAELAVECLAENLRDLEMSDRYLTLYKKEMGKIRSSIHLIKVFLRDSTMKQRNNQSHREFFRRIREVVYETEDIFDAYVLQKFEKPKVYHIIRRFHKVIIFQDVAVKLQTICEQIQNNRINAIDLSSFDDDDKWLDKTTEAAPPVIGSNVVGLEDEIDKVREYLNEETEELDVITIVGMPGIGKTTLAWKTFNHQDIVRKFPTRVWIPVSNGFRERDVFLTILKRFTKITDDISEKNDKGLAELATTYLRENKFLIVMDDVCSANDWDRIRIALPRSNEKGSKVLITSCNEHVVRHANRSRLPHKVRFLTQTESWYLLKSEVFGGKGYPSPEMESLGKQIAEQCDGLPLAILAMARTLVEEDLSSSDTIERKIAWTKASFRVLQCRNYIFYQSLPYRLRLCFLYFGMFPYDMEIPVWKVIRMWIAEGLIQQNEGGMSLEETAETYLEDLICRNLVTVGRHKSDGRVKTCRVHRILHVFCKTEAGNERENFLDEIEFVDGVWEPQVSTYRRLCIHSNVLDFLSSDIFGSRVRSFVCFSEEEAVLTTEYVSATPKAFKFIRVFDVKPIIFTEIPRDMYRFVHLRYLVISFLDKALLPKSFTSKLSKLQTLVVHTTSRTLQFQGDILHMTELRHFKTNASTMLDRHRNTGNHGQQLQTLGSISPESCTEWLLERACNLKKLGIRGPLYEFFNGYTGSLDSLAKVMNLENLKLVNDAYPHSRRPGMIRLPPPFKFPTSLMSLTLASTYLDWSQMEILGWLEGLKILKLKDNAFVGRRWVTIGTAQFQSLETLYIKRTNLALWIASSNPFPELRRLQLHYCEALQEVPMALADIPTFQHLELFNSTLAAHSARRIEKYIKIRMNQEGPSKNAKEFKLSVFPNE